MPRNTNRRRRWRSSDRPAAGGQIRLLTLRAWCPVCEGIETVTHEVDTPAPRCSTCGVDMAPHPDDVLTLLNWKQENGL